MSAFNRLLNTLRDEFAGLGSDLRATTSFDRVQHALDEEIRSAHARLHAWRDEQAALKAKRFTCQERIDALAASIREQEAAAIKALAGRKTRAARGLAEEIAMAEVRRDDERRHAQQLELLLDQLRDSIGHGENRLRRLKQQLDIVRTTQGILSAQAEVARRSSGEEFHLRTAIESAERIRRRKGSSGSRAQAPAREAEPEPMDGRAERVFERIRKGMESQARRTSSARTKNSAKGASA